MEGRAEGRAEVHEEGGKTGEVGASLGIKGEGSSEGRETDEREARRDEMTSLEAGLTRTLFAEGGWRREEDWEGR